MKVAVGVALGVSVMVGLGIGDGVNVGWVVGVEVGMRPNRLGKGSRNQIAVTRPTISRTLLTHSTGERRGGAPGWVGRDVRACRRRLPGRGPSQLAA